jgi:hypothetical protein
MHTRDSSGRQGRSLVGLVLVSVVLGTLIGLGCLALLGNTLRPGGAPEDATTGAPDPANVEPGHRDTTQDTTAGTKRPLRDLTQERAESLQGRNRATVEGRNGDNQAQHTPYTGPLVPGDLRFVLAGGKQSLTPGESFEMQVVIDGLSSALSSYALEATWNPTELSVDGVQGTKGGFPAPTQVSMATPGSASWNGSDANPTHSGSVVVATLHGQLAESASGQVRLFFTPRSIATAGTGRGLPGVPRAFTIPVK